MKNICKTLAIFALVSSNYIYSGEEGDETPENRVGFRSLSVGEQIAWQEQGEGEKAQGEKAPEEEANQNFLSAKKEEEEPEVSGYYWDRLPPVYHPIDTTFLSSVSSSGDSCVLVDGSGWAIRYRDAHKIFSWKLDHALIITQNRRMFARYKYRIINETIGEFIECDLVASPFEDGKYTRYISAIDPYRGDIIMSDGTRWYVCENDLWVLENWSLDHMIILGVNSCKGLLFSARDMHNILINVDTNTFVRANQY